MNTIHQSGLGISQPQRSIAIETYEHKLLRCLLLCTHIRNKELKKLYAERNLLLEENQKLKNINKK